MKYFSFNGVSTRQEYWAVQVIVLVSSIVVGFLMALAAGEVTALVLGIAAILALSWVSFAAMARRLRDAGLNVWWTLTYLIPYVGLIPLIVFGVLKTKE